MDDPEDAVAFLAASRNRTALLDALAERPLDRRSCYDRLDASRRTVKRALDALADRGWVDVTGENVRLTALGAAVYDAYGTVAETLRVADRLEPLLQRLPAGAFDLDVRHLADAELVSATDGGPYAPMDRVLELRRNATSHREATTVVERESVAQLADRLRAGDDLDVDIVVDAAALAEARSNPDYADGFAVARDSGAVSISVHDSLPFLLSILDDVVAIGARNESGMPAALAVSRDDAVREWADRTFARFREEATPL